MLLGTCLRFGLRRLRALRALALGRLRLGFGIGHGLGSRQEADHVSVAVLGQLHELGIVGLPQQLHEALGLEQGIVGVAGRLHHRRAHAFDVRNLLVHRSEIDQYRLQRRERRGERHAFSARGSRTAARTFLRRLDRRGPDIESHGLGDHGGFGGHVGVGTDLDLVLPVLHLVQRQQAAVAGLDHELAEPIEARVLLIEMRIDLLHDLFEAIRAHRVVAVLHPEHRLDHELPRIAPYILRLIRLGEPGQLAVAEILVAILDQQVTGRFPDSHANDPLPVFLEFQHQARKIAVARQQDERPDFGPGEYQLQRVDRQPDIGRVLLVRPECRGEDEIDRRLRQGNDVLRIAAPVGVRALDRDLASNHFRVQQPAKLVLQIGADSEGDVVKID